ncbi:molybdate ABC transporter substrate-binding protein [Curtobacterium sp. MCPF17_052]|uniref:molybdate ABC transporter substrate-binding protein n=1 Tax=Curtobacterium sp. MCPF17_052 TaxID=2175655 RepID=UPI00346436EF
MRSTAVLAAGALLALTLGGCASTPASGGPGTSATSGAAPSGSITVFAAASLQRTFTTLGHDFEQAHPGTTVTSSFAGSSDLVSQIRNGAPRGRLRIGRPGDHGGAREAAPGQWFAAGLRDEHPRDRRRPPATRTTSGAWRTSTTPACSS